MLLRPPASPAHRRTSRHSAPGPGLTRTAHCRVPAGVDHRYGHWRNSPSDFTGADDPIPVIVHLYWLDGWEADMPAAAEAWTHEAVRVRWLDVDTQRIDWVPAVTVRRRL